MWPLKKKKIHNPDCFMCCDFFHPPKVTGKCNRPGCNNPAEAIIFHFWSKGSGARWSYVCCECEKEHNAWFYGINNWGEAPTKGWLFTPPAGIVVLPPVQYAIPPEPDPILISYYKPI